MNLALKRFQISQTGIHRDSNGARHVFTDEILKNVAEEYNGRATTPNAPLYIGHPAVNRYGQREPAEPLGIVGSLEFSGGKLYAHAYVTEKLERLVKSRVYRAVSAGFDYIKNGLKLDHIAFLNNPAIKGMESLEFSDGQEIHFSELSEHERVLHYAARNGVSYESAAYAVLADGRQATNSGVCFAQADEKEQVLQILRTLTEAYGGSSGNESQKLDALAIQYQQEHGVSYKEAVNACIHLTNYR